MQDTRDHLGFPTGNALTRRALLQTLVAAAAPLALGARLHAAQAPATGADIGPLSPSVLPPGVRSRFVDGVNGLRMHVLEAGYDTPGRPALLLVHGYPELAYSWRKVMGPLAAAGYHVFVPDVRGYGRTSPTPVNYTDDLRPFGTVNQIKDMLALVSAMGYRSVAAVIGHDQGSPLAGWCALARPDVFSAGRDDERAVRRSTDPAVQHGEHARALPRRHPPHRLTRSTTTSRSFHLRASTISATTRRARRTRTCGIRHRGSRRSCAPTTT